MLNVTWAQALAWRVRRHLLDPVGAEPVAEVVARLCGVQAQVASTAELAIRLRRKASRPGEVSRALAAGHLIKTWAMRGTLHLLNPTECGSLLSLMAAGRSWERGSWQRHFAVSPADIELLRQTVRAALAGGPLTREEVAAAVVRKRRLAHVGEALGSGWGTLLKPLAWQGDLCFGPSRGNRVTFQLPEQASHRWSGLPPVEEAAPRAIMSYLAAHGPATPGSFGRWLAGGWFGQRQLNRWFEDLRESLVMVEVEGERTYLNAHDADDLAATKPNRTVRLLAGFDQYVMAPGTADPHVLPPGRRAEVSKTSGWIAPVVLAGGVIRGVWSRDGAGVRVAWFGENGRPPRAALRGEVDRLSSILDQELKLTIEVA
ncbi:MAG TPA: winged helix DNA-binding domain-containing protein [Acidimicrobiia bacterium]